VQGNDGSSGGPGVPGRVGNPGKKVCAHISVSSPHDCSYVCALRGNKARKAGKVKKDWLGAEAFLERW
jgi:hypothetical protein